MALPDCRPLWYSVFFHSTSPFLWNTEAEKCSHRDYRIPVEFNRIFNHAYTLGQYQFIAYSLIVTIGTVYLLFHHTRKPVMGRLAQIKLMRNASTLPGRPSMEPTWIS